MKNIYLFAYFGVSHDVRESADLQTEEGRKSGIIYSYTCSRIIFHYYSLITLHDVCAVHRRMFSTLHTYSIVFPMTYPNIYHDIPPVY